MMILYLKRSQMNEDIEFKVEDGIIDTEELKKADYQKYRELYRLIAKINQLPENAAYNEKMDALKELMDHKLYSDAVKSSFFLDKLAESINEGGFYYEMSCMIESDLRLYLEGDDPKYAKLKNAIKDAHLYHSYRDNQAVSLRKKRKKNLILAPISSFFLIVISLIAFINWIAVFNFDSFVSLGVCVISATGGIFMTVRTIIYYINKK